jgi:hypothetical protein
MTHREREKERERVRRWALGKAVGLQRSQTNKRVEAQEANETYID